MKTKNIIINCFAIIAGASLMNGCSLDEYNPSGGPTLIDQVSTVAGYGQLVNSCYYPLTRTWTGGGEDYTVFLAECGTDLWTCPQGDGYLKEVFYYDNLNGAVGSLGEGWQCSYESINDCNAAIHYASLPEFKSEAERNTKVAEAHYLRAFFNFFLIEQYGAKYLPQEETTTPITDVPMATLDQFYDLIFSDLKFAMQHLPYTQTEIGRATRGAAYHLYAKVCLQYAGYDSTPNKQQLYTDAKNAALEIINNRSAYGLELYNEPSDIFKVTNNKTNKEAVWVATHSQNGSLNPRGGNYWNRVYKQFGCLQEDGSCGVKWNISTEYVKFDMRIMPTLALLDLYSDKDLRYDAFFKEKYYATTDYTWSAGDCAKYQKNNDSFVGKKTISTGDLAMYFTRQNINNPESFDYACFDRDMLYNADGTINKNVVRYGYPSLKKFEAPGMYNGELGKSYTWADHLVYRLSETYLLAGEACFRLNETNEAVNYFNIIRNRACQDHDGSMNISAADVNVDFILSERARELCGEYTRFMDLKRMGKSVMEQYVNSNPDIKAKGKFVVNTHYLRPVPESKELNYQKNPSEFQNPGY